MAVAVVLGLMLLALYTPLRGFLDLEPLGVADLGLCALLGAGLLVAMEAAKAGRGSAPSWRTDLLPHPKLTEVLGPAGADVVG